MMDVKMKKYVPGRVTLEHKRMYRVVTAEGEWFSVCSGAMQYEADERRDFPAVGDWVQWKRCLVKNAESSMPFYREHLCFLGK